MNIALFSSYGMKCGIAEYNLSMHQAFKQLGHNVTIFANRIDKIRADRKLFITAENSLEQNIEVVRCFHAGTWSESLDFDYQLMFQELEKRQIELLIMQYQNGIFHDQNLRPLFFHCKEKGIHVIVTFHDSCVGPHFPYDLVEHYVCTHSRMAQLVGNSRYIPHGFPPPVTEKKGTLKNTFCYDDTIVTTFGLGRTDFQLLSDVTRGLHYRFAILDSSNSCRLGGDHLIYIRDWLSMEQLLLRLAASDAVVLWYPEIDAMVSSSALCVALASLRPVIVNDVNWFKDVPDDVVMKVKDENELREILSEIDRFSVNQRQVDYVMQNQWTSIAQKYLEILC